MRSGRVFLLAWLGLWALSPAHAAGAADAMLAEVSSALAAGKYEEVVAVASSGLAEPDTADLTRGRLLIVRGLARQALGTNDEALADFTQSLSIAALPPQERARALFARGVSLDSLNRLTDAAGDYGAVLKLVPDAPYALNNRANVYRRLGRLDDALRDYKAALNPANPNLQYPYFGLGQIAEAQGDREGARSYYNRALAAAPGFALALERLQTLGAPVEGSAGLPADTGIIVLKPPQQQRAGTFRPLVKEEADTPSVTAPRAPMAAAAVAVQSPLRPTIVDGMAAHDRAAMVQLGSWRSEAEARAGWLALRVRARGLLDKLSPTIVRVEIPGRGAFYRLRTAPPDSAAQFCATLTQRGLDCMAAYGAP